MISLAIRADRIIRSVFTSLPPGDLIFDYAPIPGFITYTLRIRQIKIGTIEVEDDSFDPVPRSSPHLRLAVAE